MTDKRKPATVGDQIRRLRHEPADGPARLSTPFSENAAYEAMLKLRERDPHAYKQLSVTSRLGLGFYENAKERSAAAEPAPGEPPKPVNVDNLDDAYKLAETRGVTGTDDPLFKRAQELRRDQLYNDRGGAS